MKVLIVAATKAEVEFLHKNQIVIDTLTTGPGLVRSSFGLTKHLIQNKYDLCVQAGIAGSFDRTLKLGEVVNVVSDFLPEEGAEDGNEFMSIYDLKLAEKNNSVFNDGILQNDFKSDIALIEEIKSVKGLTRITCTGSLSSVERFGRFGASIESMEGAAFFFVCRSLNIPCLQIRAISNYVEKRNRKLWETGLALKNLELFILKLLKQLHAC